MGGGNIAKTKTAAQLEDEVTKLARTLDLEQVSDVDIDKGLELIEDVHRYLEQTNFNKCRRCIAVLGTTGVGKSTLVSLLFGEGKLLVHHENAYSRVLVAEKPLPGVDICSGSASKTLLPGVTRTCIDDEDVVVFDMPGSHDTRGPFAELIVHSILKWMLAKHEQMNFLLVATPPQDRPQEVKLADMINRVYDGSSNAVLVYMKCDADFEPGSAEFVEGIEPDKRKIPAFALMKPAKSDEEGHDYSERYQSARRALLDRLVVSVSPLGVLEGSVPESAQLLLQSFCNRSIGKARDAISREFVRIYQHGYLRRSLDEISALLDALASQEPLDFTAMTQLLQLVLPRLCRLRTGSARSVSKAANRLELMERWTGRRVILCKEEWLTEQCRNVLKDAESSLITLKEKVSNYREVVKNRETKTVVISAWHLHLSEEDIADIKDFVRMVHTHSGIPTVVLVGFSRVTIDIPLRVWANVIIVSPIARINVIDLSAEGSAPARVPSRAGPGEDGIHGRPGLYGGNFVLVCKKLLNDGNTVDLFKSTGQQGGPGQNAGRGVDGVDAVNSVSSFKASAEALARQLTSLEKWEAAFNKLPGGIELEKRSIEELPPTDDHVRRAAVGAAAVGVSMAITVVDPKASAVVVVAGCAFGGKMIHSAFGRNTKTELKLVRHRVMGERGVPPGYRGKGGNGGLGGEFYVFESGKETLKWQGAPGFFGEPGKKGKDSSRGRSSNTVRGSILHEYDSSGQQVGKAMLKVTEEVASSPCKRSEKLFTPRRRPAPTPNPLLPFDAAKVHYEEVFKQLGDAFPQSDFADIDMP